MPKRKRVTEQICKTKKTKWIWYDGGQQAMSGMPHENAWENPGRPTPAGVKIWGKLGADRVRAIVVWAPRNREYTTALGQGTQIIRAKLISCCTLSARSRIL